MIMISLLKKKVFRSESNESKSPEFENQSLPEANPKLILKELLLNIKCKVLDGKVKKTHLSNSKVIFSRNLERGHCVVYYTSPQSFKRQTSYSLAQQLWGLLLNLIGGFIKLSVQKILPLIVIYRKFWVL